MDWQNCTAVISSDWNQCLAPCGPFDPISFNYPALSADLNAIFRQYTGNRITLSSVNRTIAAMCPAPLTTDQMDAYLDASFETYPGVADFIAWCRSEGILFMINTTGLTGYFQRVFANGLLPSIPVLSSNPMLRYPSTDSDPPICLDLKEIQDKGRNTEWVIRSLKYPHQPCVLIGDSGGDGPHFEWGARHGAFLIGNMPKPSLLRYCRLKGIAIDLIANSNHGGRGFMQLVPVIEKLIGRPAD